MNWQYLIDWQITSFGGNPAVMVEVTHGPMDSVHYTVSEVVRRGLTDSIQTHHCREEDSEALAAKFKDGAVSFAFLNGKPTYEGTLTLLHHWYPKVHYNSLMAGTGIDDPEVKRALDYFCGVKMVPWREFSPGVWAIHHCHRMGQ